MNILHYIIKPLIQCYRTRYSDSIEDLCPSLNKVTLVPWNKNLYAFKQEYDVLLPLKKEIVSNVKRTEITSHLDRKRCISELQDIIENDTHYKRFSTEDLRCLGERYPKFTSESDVYIDKLNQVVYKSKDIFGHDAMKAHHPCNTIYEYLLHNILFPNVPYHLEGIGTRNGQPSLVFSQPYIDFREAQIEEIDRYFELMELKNNCYHEYCNEYFSIHDCCGANVLSDSQGGIFVIDPVVEFKKEPLEVFKYVLGINDKDLEKYSFE